MRYWFVSIPLLVVVAGAVAGVARGSSRYSGSGALTISAIPNPSTAGTRVTISGRLYGSSPAGAAVTLWQRSPSSSSFHRVASATTDSSGHYAFVRAPDSGSFFSATASDLRSRTVDEQVHAAVSLSSSDPNPVPGERVSLRGQVVPSHAGQRVALQRQEGKRWRTVATQKLKGRSRFSIAVMLSKPTHFVFRAVLPADARNVWSHSPVVSLDASEIHKIKHVVIIMQENRSFDQYFGTFPAGRGDPGPRGQPGGCLAFPTRCTAAATDPSTIAATEIRGPALGRQRASRYGLREFG